jgi:hypothetical protein
MPAETHAGDPIADIYQQYKHLDHLLSDREWMCPSVEPGDEDGTRLSRMYGHYLADFWQAIKAEIERRRQPQPERICTWTPFSGWDEEGNYDTQCQTAFSMLDDRPPNELDFFYCPRCGGKIVALPKERESNGEDNDG